MYYKDIYLFYTSVITTLESIDPSGPMEMEYKEFVKASLELT